LAYSELKARTAHLLKVFVFCAAPCNDGDFSNHDGEDANAQDSDKEEIKAKVSH
jgi:hypothetical protein